VSGDYHVDFVGLADTIAALEEFERWWDDTVAELDTTITDLHVDWFGKAASAHQDAYARWTDGTAKLRDVLKRLHGSGHLALGNYSAATDAGKDIWMV
jgi:uncharacterized protein YukE